MNWEEIEKRLVGMVVDFEKMRVPALVTCGLVLTGFIFGVMVGRSVADKTPPSLRDLKSKNAGLKNLNADLQKKVDTFQAAADKATADGNKKAKPQHRVTILKVTPHTAADGSLSWYAVLKKPDGNLINGRFSKPLQAGETTCAEIYYGSEATDTLVACR